MTAKSINETLLQIRNKIYRKEAELAVTHLLKSGCRDIALAGFDTDSPSLAPRSRGWEDAYHHAGLNAPYHLRISVETLLHAKEKVREFIRTQQFSAIFSRLK